MTDPGRERSIKPMAVPASLAAQVEGYDWARDTVGEAGAAVYRLSGSGKLTLYLKHGADAVATDVTDEMTRLEWLGRHLPVPRVVHFTASLGEAWLLMTAIPGRTALQCLVNEADHREETVVAITDFLRLLHALPVETCPFNSGHLLRLAEAKYRLDAGEVDAADFDKNHKGWTARQVWQAVTDLLPFDADRVVTHGDYSLDNIVLENGRVVGCIDVGRLGSADRYQDLAILSHCLGEFDHRLQDVMWRTYGIAEPDRAKIAFHLGLDEMF